jgi:mannosyltransferase
MAALSPAGLAVFAVALGGLLRWYRYNALSLWVDEGLTVMHARLSWPLLLGFGRIYDPHPPLYYALVKLTSYVVPEVTAGRLLSVIAGTLTIVVVYALVTRLLHPWAGALAAVALAVAPLHLWYSQEARQYAVTALLVAMTYLALVAYVQSGRRCWAAIYGLAILLALYTEYSALFALAPQLLLLTLLLVTRRERAGALIGAGLLAGLCFLPWLPRLLAVVGPTSAQAQFTLSPARITATLLSIVGVAGNSSYFYGSVPTPWDVWPVPHALYLLALAPAIASGILVVARRSALALLTAAGLLVGTIACAAAVSLRYPSYTERTVLYAVLGWAIVVGAASFAVRHPRWLRALVILSMALLLTLDMVTAATIYAGADKQNWRTLAADTAAAARLGLPVITYPSVSGVLITLYQPHALDRRHIALADDDTLTTARLLDQQGKLPDGLWASYIDTGNAKRVLAPLAGWGYVRLLHIYYFYPLYLDLYARPTARLGRNVAVNGTFRGMDARAVGWRLPRDSVALLSDGAGGRELLLPNGADGQGATLTIRARPGHLYTLRLAARSRLASGFARAYLSCLSDKGTLLAIAPDGGGAAAPNDGRWHPITIAALCPTATRALRIDLRHSGSGQAYFRTITVHAIAPVGP